MSGSGQNDFSAPAYLTPIAGDEPIAMTPDGVECRPTMHFVQMIQRILSYLGQPTSGNLASHTLSRQVGTNNVVTSVVMSAPGAAAAGIEGRLLKLESVASRQNSPLPQPPGLGQAQVLARIWFSR